MSIPSHIRLNLMLISVAIIGAAVVVLSPFWGGFALGAFIGIASRPLYYWISAPDRDQPDNVRGQS